MVQSTKTMLRVRDNEIARLRQKMHQMDIHAGTMGLGVDASERYFELQQSTQIPRGYNRSLDSKGMKNMLALDEKYAYRPSHIEGEEDRLDKSIHSPAANEGGENDEVQETPKKQGFLPSIEKGSTSNFY
mgnify:FL=1